MYVVLLIVILYLQNFDSLKFELCFICKDFCFENSLYYMVAMYQEFEPVLKLAMYS